jgi:hypothetical protein
MSRLPGVVSTLFESDKEKTRTEKDLRGGRGLVIRSMVAAVSVRLASAFACRSPEPLMQ